VEIGALTTGKKTFDNFLNSYLSNPGISSGIFEAFSYSLKAGGKRIRPILAMLACECAGGTKDDALPAGLAIEMIHTFSLIHDDLPAIDNDGLRRGLPTCHAKFGEATAILAGDALIFEAMSVILNAPYPRDVSLDILARLSEACGVHGLIQGEYEDIMAEGRDITFEGIREIHRKKTSRLFELCMYAGSRIATADAGIIGSLQQYGTCLGLAFQAIDDILDLTSNGDIMGKTTGKDLSQDKATVVKSLGLAQARAWAEEMTHKAVSSIAGMEGHASGTLKEIALWMLNRVR
jgi:geranylgeranyl diphosphate synthase, type II